MDYSIADIKLAGKGKERVEWAYQDMPVLRLLREKYKAHKVFTGGDHRMLSAPTTETANLAVNLKQAGAKVSSAHQIQHTERCDGISCKI